jgi:hypothetical protein
LAEQDCSPCKYVLCTAFRCTPILCVKTRLWNIEGTAIAVECAQTVTFIAIIVSIIRIIPQPKVAFRVGIHCRLQANCIIHHGRTVFAASSSGIVSFIDHQGAFSHET